MSGGLQTAAAQSLRRGQPFATPWTAARQAPLSFTISLSLLKLMPIESVMPSNHLNLYRPFSCLQSFPASESFSSESAFHIRWAKYWNFSFSISPSNEYSGLISYRADWLDPLAVQQESSPTPQFKIIILWLLTFFMVQLLHPYMAARKTIALTI